MSVKLLTQRLSMATVKQNRLAKELISAKLVVKNLKAEIKKAKVAEKAAKKK